MDGFHCAEGMLDTIFGIKLFQSLLHGLDYSTALTMNICQYWSPSKLFNLCAFLVLLNAPRAMLRDSVSRRGEKGSDTRAGIKDSKRLSYDDLIREHRSRQQNFYFYLVYILS